MRIRIAVLALASGLLAAVVAPAGAASAGTAQPSSDGLVAGAGVITLAQQTSAPARTSSGATIQASTYCNVSVSQPQVNASLILSGTWRVSCRNGANPAPDIFEIEMTARIYQGTPALPGANVGAHYCLTHTSPIMDCPVSTTGPIQYYTSYFSKLEVEVTLTSGAVNRGTFYTYPTQLT
ncbi:hypothetical protein Rhe02_90390 [Rhizocola hellebori]|uniref:Phosphatidylglycerol/phosphatidylinositol transfer protein n=1 Tax=Rhizocola hellebori TaxID=1392758 RepID=A0A8J3QJV9_9ACTN|nr:hypothetical protein [Rhizocola hellebori]GIH10972.1 hypothetical protein Rhe02_90390 [Rhizocola hellebori]